MKLVSAELAARQEANNGGSARMVFPVGEVATAGSRPAGADEVVTEEESEFIAHRSPELEAAEAKARARCGRCHGRGCDGYGRRRFWRR